MSSNPARAIAQSPQIKFANETPRQQVQHREIARRYARKRRTPTVKQSVRIRELDRLFEYRYGKTLPNDDSGYDDAFVMACHLAHLAEGPARITCWMQMKAPWLIGDDLASLIEMATRRRTMWKADALADRLNLDYETRQLLGIGTIGAIDFRKRSRTALRRKKDAERKRASRAKAGVKPQAQSARRQQPWKQLGISRTSYYRRGEHLKSGTSGTNSATPLTP
jgi:hypothetical protein